MQGLKGITYSEFDNIVGPQLRFSYPPDVLPKDIFEPLSDYVIVGKHLCGKIIVVKTQELQFLNYSVSIDNPKYERNTLLFSFGFVLDPGERTEPFEPLLRKISSVMVSLELERDFLFQPAAKQRIAEILPHLYQSLHVHGEAFLQLDAHNILALKPFRPISPQPRVLADHEVPLLKYDPRFMSHLPWDLSLQHLLPSIDGTRYIKRIAREAEMDIDCVRQSLRTLLFYDCVLLVDVFRFSNVYQLERSAEAALASTDSPEMAEMEEFCAVPQAPHPLSSGNSPSWPRPGDSFSASSSALSSASPSAASTSMASTPTPSTHSSSSGSSDRRHRIARILSSLRPGRTLAEVLCCSHGGEADLDSSYGGGGSAGLTVHLPAGLDGQGRGRDDNAHSTPSRDQLPTTPRRPSASAAPGVLSTAGIDLRRLLAIAQVKGVLRRLHEYPVHGCMERDDEAAEDNDNDSVDGSSAQNSLNSSAQGSLGRRHVYARFAAAAGRPATFNTQCPSLPSIPALDAEKLSALNGSMSLDAFCCCYDVPPAAVLQHPDVFLVYK